MAIDEFEELIGGGSPDQLESFDIAPEVDPVDPSIAAQVEQEDQDKNFSRFNLPIPGQSLTAEPGSAAYEQPPQYTDVDDVADYLLERMVNPHIQRDLLRLLDAKVPAANLAEVILMQGASDGKWSIDMAMMAMEPAMAILYGLGSQAGIDVVTHKAPKRKGINTSRFRKQAKEELESKREELVPELKNKEAAKGLMSRPEGVE